MPHTFQTDKILPNLNAITFIWYHNKHCIDYIHKLQTPNKMYGAENEYIYQCKQFCYPYFHKCHVCYVPETSKEF